MGARDNVNTLREKRMTRWVPLRLSVSKLADESGVPYSTIEKAITRGELPAVRHRDVDRGHYVLASDFARWMERCWVPVVRHA